VTLVTGGIVVDLGPIRVSSRHWRNPVIVAVGSALWAWWISRRLPAGDRISARDVRTLLAIGCIATAFAAQVLLLYRPHLLSLRSYSLATPDAFGPMPALDHGVLAMLFAAAALAMAIGLHQWPRISARPLAGLAAIFLFGLALHLGFLRALQSGTPTFATRAITSAHGEFLREAVLIEDLGATLRDYQTYVRPRTYLSAKGQGTLIFFHALKTIANVPIVGAALVPLTPDITLTRAALAEYGTAPGSARAERAAEELGRLLALMTALYPVLTILPVVLVFHAGRMMVDESFGLLAALVYTMVPAVNLSIAHLDVALFPLLTAAVMVGVAEGVRRRRMWPVALAAAAFVLYFFMTLAALTAVALAAVYLASLAWQRIARGERLAAVSAETAAAGCAFGVTAGFWLAVLYAGLNFDPVERYSYARDLQRRWVTPEYNLFWATGNALGYALSFGIAQSIVLLAQLARSTWRSIGARADGIDGLAVSWAWVFVALLVFGRQHGETNRLWAFLSPIGALLVARWVYDLVPGRWRWIPLILFLAGLFLVRLTLTYT
jgi:hypothetical protein